MAREHAVGSPALTDADYARLLTFRTQLRRFDQWSREQAASFGLTHTQHQLLLVVRGHGDERGPTIRQVAEHLLVRHHTAVELVDRAEELGLVARHGDPDDHRVVRLTLTTEGAQRVLALAALHLEELQRLAPALGALVGGLPGQPPVADAG